MKYINESTFAGRLLMTVEMEPGEDVHVGDVFEINGRRLSVLGVAMQRPSLPPSQVCLVVREAT